MREKGIVITMMTTREGMREEEIIITMRTVREKISVTVATLAVKTTPANDVELVRVIVMKTRTVNEAWCVEKTTVVPGALGSTPRMIAAGSHVMEMTVAVAKIMLVKRVRATVTVTPTVRTI